ncbi:MAG: HAMP domain-containing sensor histidine kinase [Acidobacteriota bacterium]
MDMTAAGRQMRYSWTLIGVLALLCAVLAVVQYRWIDEVAQANRERIKSEREAGLRRVRQEFNEELRSVSTISRTARFPGDNAVEENEQRYVERYRRWASSAVRERLVKRVALAVPRDGRVELKMLDATAGAFQAVEWPAEWTGAKERFEARALRNGPPPNLESAGAFVEFPIFEGRGPGQGTERAWLMVEFDVDYLRGEFLRQLLRKHMGEDAGADDRYLVVSRRDPSVTIAGNRAVEKRAGEPVPVFDELRGPGGGQSRWLLYVSNSGGRLDALVERARWRNVAWSAVLFALLLATAWVLIRYTREEQRLAELQMNFVAGVSHELRTPLAVIGTAAYNLRGKLSGNAAQVVRYGSLIETEAQKLTAMVEQILQFASVRSGKSTLRSEAVLMEDVIEEGLRSSKELQAAECEVEKRIEPRLPVVLGDGVALRHAIQNLLSNAAKYGTEGSKWVGVMASSAETEAGPFVEIRVADHGPGIPLDEQAHIFDPFFRGKYAMQDQIHGTGLGLDLVRRIVEAHGGTIRVESAPMQGAEFVMRIPAAPAEYQDEFSHTAG